MRMYVISQIFCSVVVSFRHSHRVYMYILFIDVARTVDTFLVARDLLCCSSFCSCVGSMCMYVHVRGTYITCSYRWYKSAIEAEQS